MVDLAQHGTSSDNSFAVGEEVFAEGLDEGGYRGGALGTGSDTGIESGW